MLLSRSYGTIYMAADCSSYVHGTNRWYQPRARDTGLGQRRFTMEEERFDLNSSRDFVLEIISSTNGERVLRVNINMTMEKLLVLLQDFSIHATAIVWDGDDIVAVSSYGFIECSGIVDMYMKYIEEEKVQY